MMPQFSLTLAATGTGVQAGYARLPHELCVHIIGFLSHDIAALRCCSLVCHAWTPIVYRRLFYTVEVPTSLNPIVGFLCFNPVPASFVRHLVLWSGRAVDNLTMTPNVNCVSIYGLSGTLPLLSQQPSFPSVRRLILGYSEIWPDDFERIFVLFPNVTRLELKYVTGPDDLYQDSCRDEAGRGSQVLKDLRVRATDNHITFWLARRMVVRRVTNLELEISTDSQAIWLFHLMRIDRGPRHLFLSFPDIIDNDCDFCENLLKGEVPANARLSSLRLHCDYDEDWSAMPRKSDPILIMLRKVRHVPLRTVHIRVILYSKRPSEFNTAHSKATWARLGKRLGGLSPEEPATVSVELVIQNTAGWPSWKNAAAALVESSLGIAPTTGVHVNVQCI